LDDSDSDAGSQAECACGLTPAQFSFRAKRGSEMSVNRSPAIIRVGLVTDEPIRLEGLVSIFEQQPQGGARFQPVTGSLEDLLSLHDLDCLIVGRSSSAEGVQILQRIRRERPAIRQIVIGPLGNDELTQQSIMAGARAYLDLAAGPEMVLRAIEEVMTGDIWAPRRVLSRLIDRLLTLSEFNSPDACLHLTDREQEVLDLILLARSNREIADHLGIEERTVKAHVGRLMRKTGAENRIELSMRALNDPQIPGLGHPDRRGGERRRADRRQGDRRK
jgi:DNA-binding NarL/FixJ family response regulator